jgi:hypothetical protein
MEILDKVVENAKMKYRVGGRDMYGALDSGNEADDDADYAAGEGDGPDES